MQARNADGRGGCILQHRGPAAWTVAIRAICPFRAIFCPFRPKFLAAADCVPIAPVAATDVPRRPTTHPNQMKISTLVSCLAAVLCLATSSSAAISIYLMETTVVSGQSLKMDWNPNAGWSAQIGNHTGGDSLYLTPKVFEEFDGDIYETPAMVGCWAYNAFSISTSNRSADGLIDGTLSYSNHTESNPAGNGTYFAGLRYDLGEGNFNYGWVNYSTNADSTVITFLGAAFNTTANESILPVRPRPSPRCRSQAGSWRSRV